MARNDETYEKDEVTLVHKTDAAILIRDSDIEEEDAELGENQWWVPRSLIVSTDLDRVGEEGYVEIPEWFAEKEGIC